ncbi:hypothetical protein HAP48_0026485 [Bradyrhizobium septentrionale]|nr:hypothetical protein [Bradyrhizobium septentrionale]UGY12268.1 hypothetical protein HAP48_0026485 [Bradyrhizobium septentrionale]
MRGQCSASIHNLEVSGLDRPGLLYQLTTAISKLNLNIALGACRDLRRARPRGVLCHRPARRPDHRADPQAAIKSALLHLLSTEDQAAKPAA